MSDNYSWLKTRSKKRKLVIVEGKHEKNCFLKLLFKYFPELKMDIDDVEIYGTNIYQLYDDITDKYSENWDSEDVDRPY
jgi:hypothetical protein